jgi:hypothetical protein
MGAAPGIACHVPRMLWEIYPVCADGCIHVLPSVKWHKSQPSRIRVGGMQRLLHNGTLLTARSLRGLH